MRRLRISAILIAFLLLLGSCSLPETPPNDSSEATSDGIGESLSDSMGETQSPVGSTEEETSDLPVKERECVNYTDMKCLWISQFDLSSVYTLNGKQRSEKDFRLKMETILDNTVACGFNTVFLQMRPNADSMYPSEVYPPSVYVVGAYGASFSYDPISIVVDMAHERGLSIHAWINPMRGMKVSELMEIDSGYAIRAWYDDAKTKGKSVVTVGDRVYLNPAYPEVRELIVSGAEEILRRYPVDGLHMDDYFYPTAEASFDRAAYEAYLGEGGAFSLSEFRRSALNALVSTLYSTVKRCSSLLLFGISPAGNWNTVYETQFADVYTWCGESGYIDYICPQVYFGMEHQNFDFVKTCAKWQSMIRCEEVFLLVGMTLGKAKSGVDAYAGSGKNEWQTHKDVLYRCLMHTETLATCRGVSYFCYQYFYSPTTGASVPETETERGNFLPLLRRITWADKNSD